MKKLFLIVFISCVLSSCGRFSHIKAILSDNDKSGETVVTPDTLSDQNSHTTQSSSKEGDSVIVDNSVVKNQFVYSGASSLYTDYDFRIIKKGDTSGDIYMIYPDGSSSVVIPAANVPVHSNYISGPDFGGDSSQKMVFLETNSANQWDLYHYDLVSQNFTLLKQFTTVNTQPRVLEGKINNFIFFSAQEVGDPSGVSFWVSDGTALGTKKILDNNNVSDAQNINYEFLNGKLYFKPATNPTAARVMVTDGTVPGTQVVYTAPVGESLSAMKRVGDHIYFTLEDSPNRTLFQINKDGVLNSEFGPQTELDLANYSYYRDGEICTILPAYQGCFKESDLSYRSIVNDLNPSANVSEIKYIGRENGLDYFARRLSGNIDIYSLSNTGVTLKVGDVIIDSSAVDLTVEAASLSGGILLSIEKDKNNGALDPQLFKIVNGILTDITSFFSTVKAQNSNQTIGLTSMFDNQFIFYDSRYEESASLSDLSGHMFYLFDVGFAMNFIHIDENLNLSTSLSVPYTSVFGPAVSDSESLDVGYYYGIFKLHSRKRGVRDPSKSEVNVLNFF